MGCPASAWAFSSPARRAHQGATLGLRAQFQELTRYLKQDLVNIVVGVGNSRGDVSLDPAEPLADAEKMGRRLFAARVADYRFDTVRSHSVWAWSGRRPDRLRRGREP